MNFIGHAKVALWTGHAPPGFVLGAMLPDFASMAGIRLGDVAAPEVAAGVSLHLRTDDVFHAAAPFVGLMQGAVEALTGRGVARGPARAVGHIGVELLIDGELVREREVGDAYLSALETFARLPSDSFAALDTAPMQRLRTRLIDHGIPYDYERPQAVTSRLVHILAGRPRLALSAEAQAVVGSIMPDLQARVRERLPELLEAVRHGLADQRCSSNTTG